MKQSSKLTALLLTLLLLLSGCGQQRADAPEEDSSVEQTDTAEQPGTEEEADAPEWGNKSQQAEARLRRADWGISAQEMEALEQELDQFPGEPEVYEGGSTAEYTYTGTLQGYPVKLTYTIGEDGLRMIRMTYQEVDEDFLDQQARQIRQEFPDAEELPAETEDGIVIDGAFKWSTPDDEFIDLYMSDYGDGDIRVTAQIRTL